MTGSKYCKVRSTFACEDSLLQVEPEVESEPEAPAVVQMEVAPTAETPAALAEKTSEQKMCFKCHYTTPMGLSRPCGDRGVVHEHDPEMSDEDTCALIGQGGNSFTGSKFCKVRSTFACEDSLL